MNKILIWGTGNIANKILKNGLNAEIMGFIETYKVKESFQDKPIYSITEIPENYYRGKFICKRNLSNMS